MFAFAPTPAAHKPIKKARRRRTRVFIAILAYGSGDQMFVFQLATKKMSEPQKISATTITPTTNALVDKFSKVQEFTGMNEPALVRQAATLLNKIYNALPNGDVKSTLKELKDPKIAEGLGPFTDFSATTPLLGKQGNAYSLGFVLGGEVYNINFTVDKQNIKIISQSAETRRPSKFSGD